MPPSGNQVRKSVCPTNELWARTNEDKGKDGQGQVTGRMGKEDYGQDGQGQWQAGTKKSWMPTHPGESQAWMPKQTAAQVKSEGSPLNGHLGL